MSIVVAVDESGGFGKSGGIPWNHPADFKHFQMLTKGGICIMGRRTYSDMKKTIEDRNSKKDPKNQTDLVHNDILPNRTSYVITSDNKYNAPGAKVAATIRSAFDDLPDSETRPIFFIGGFRIFIEALSWVNILHMTVIPGSFDCDTFFPIKILHKKFVIKEGTIEDSLKFITYVRR
jgi:dihydrofolate reductase